MNNKKKNTTGFSLVEIILAVAIFSLLITSFVGAYLYGQEATIFAGNRSRGVMYAREGLEGVRNIRDAGFENLIDGAYELSSVGGVWELSLTGDSLGIFERAVEISSINQNKKEVIVDVFWQDQRKENSVSLKSILTDWTKEQGDDELDDFLGYWPLDENSGCLTYDSNGNHEGSLDPNCPTYGPLWVSGKINSALLFDGGSNMVVVENEAALNPLSELTISAWVKWEIDPRSGNRWATIINKNGDRQYRLQHNSLNEFFEFAIRTSSGNRWVLSTTSPVQDEWYHVAGTYNGSEIKIYVNGVLENSNACSGDINISTTPLVFGNRISGDRSFEGIVDEIGLWGRALSDEEIEELYLRGTLDDDDEPLIESCNDYCISISYSGGVCRQNPRQCTNNNEDYESGGDQYCPGPPQRDCCCY